jgi:hypothetical protein
MNMSHVDDGTFHAYLDGELSPPEIQGVEGHLAQCPGCRTRLEEERALISRAAELLGRAAPPDRELPPFRIGDGKPPTRLWWQVRLPLAWAATIALALGIGFYLGPAAGRFERPVPRADSDRAATPTPAPPAPTAEIASRAPRAPRAQKRVAAGAPPAEPRPAPAPLAAAALDSLAPAAGAARPEARLALKSETAARGRAPKGTPIGIDSARSLLGTDPVAVPGLPVRALYRGREIGYSALVIVEQALDSNTTIEVVNGLPAPLGLSAVVVTGAGAAQPDSVSAAERALVGRIADSQGAARKRNAAPARGPVPGLVVEVRGPLSTDSLAALRRLLRPLQP